MKYRTARQRAASRRNIRKAQKVRAHDTWTHYGRKGLTKLVSKATLGTSSLLQGK